MFPNIKTDTIKSAAVINIFCSLLGYLRDLDTHAAQQC